MLLAWNWTPKTKLFVLIFSVVIVFIVLLDLIGIHLPYIARYLALMIAVVLYALLTKILGKLK